MSLRQYLEDKNPPGFTLVYIYYRIYFNLKYYELLNISIKNEGEKMSEIKKWLPVLVMILAIPFTVASYCGDGNTPNKFISEDSKPNRPIEEQSKIVVKTTETVAAVKETVAESKVKGTTYETDKFSILVPDGWVTKDLTNDGAIAVMVTKGEDLMQLVVYLNPYYTADYPDAKAYSKYLIDNTIEQQNGTAIKEVKMFDVTFFKTSFTANGMEQTSFAGDKNGEVVNIIMGGKDNQNNVEIKAMLDSIKFK